MHSLAIYGGTFDPIHNGHLYVALAVNQFFAFNQTLFIPCKQPVLKSNVQASVLQRVAMLRLALSSFQHFQIDLREIDRDSQSFMIETLQSLRQEYPENSLTLIMGSDSFAQLEEWYQWQELLTYGNIIVVNRTEKIVTNAALQHAHTNNPEDILQQKCGFIYFLELPLCDISSTQIRKIIREQGDITGLVPEAVKNYIFQKAIYS